MSKRKSESRVGRWIIVWNNYTEENLTTLKQCLQTAQYAIIGRERGASGTPHLQCYVNWGTRLKKTFHQMKSMLPACHLEKANGNDEQNKAYCSKEQVEMEIGEISTPGKRTDLLDVAKKLKETKNVAKVAEEFPVAYIKYHRGIEKLNDIYQATTERQFKTEVYVLIGPPGTGKSRYCFQMASASSYYYKPRGDWWDGYDGQDSVIIDDYYGWLKYDELLKITDRYPYRVPIKGGYKQFVSKKIFITSNSPIERWYKFQGYEPAALLRRIEHLYVDIIPVIEPELTEAELNDLLAAFDD